MCILLCMLTTQHMYVLFTSAYNYLTAVKLDLCGALIICLMAQKTSLSCRTLSLIHKSMAKLYKHMFYACSMHAFDLCCAIKAHLHSHGHVLAADTWAI